MKLSTRGRYGTVAMLDLALHYNESSGPVSLKSISDRQGFSEEYLEQIFSALRKSGLVESVRGAQGGYKPGRPINQITVGDILRTLEGSLSPVDCVKEKDPAVCERYDNCVVRDVWAKIRDEINETVDSITMAALVDQYNSSDNSTQNMYYI